MAAANSDAVELLLTNIPGLPQAEINGLPGVFFDPGTGSSDFDRVYGSPNGNWIVTAFADLATSEDEMVLVNGVMMQREGTPALWSTSGELAGSMDQRCDVNNAGDFTFSNNTDATTMDEYIVTNVGGVFGVGANEGSSIPALPGTTYGSILESALMLGNSEIGFSADFIDGTGLSTDDDLLILAGNVLLQEGTTIPLGQAAGGMEFIENYDLGDFWTNEAGDHWIVQGDLTGASSTDDVVIVDGTVVIQEGVIIPGSGFPNPVDGSGIAGVHMDNGGNWFARGDNDGTELDWVVRNGVVIAQRDAPIFPGSSENYSDAAFFPTFFSHIGNSVGDWIVGGVTDNADPLLNGVLVLNGMEVICRESDPIDLDGNGLFDDDAFINAFGNDDIAFSDDGMVIFIATAKDSTGAALGQVVLRLDTTGGTLGDNYCMANPNSTMSPGVISAVGSPIIAQNNVTLVAGSVPANVFGFFIVSRTEGFIANPGGSSGNLCVLGDIGRYVAPGRIQNSGPGAEFSLAIDLGMIPQPMGFVAAQPGESWSFQCWHRDTSSGMATSNFTNGVSVVFN